jgi:hypothetical protein
MDVAARLASVATTLADADADLVTELGGQQELTHARLWRGRVLVDWEPDAAAGGILLRAELLERLIALHADVLADEHQLRIRASGRIVAALSAEHADLVTRLGGSRRVELLLELQFDAAGYRGGRETYFLVERGQKAALLQLSAAVQPRLKTAGEGSPHTSPGRS